MLFRLFSHGIIVFILCCLTLESGFASENVAQPFGRFVGVLRHEGLQRDQLAKLDFIASREEKGELLLTAVLTLHFGDFRSGEYVGYHFDRVRYNPLNQSFVFHQADQALTIAGVRYSGDEFSAEVQVGFDYPSGTHQLILRRDGVAEPKLPLIEPVWGEYRGNCQNRKGQWVPSVVQLQTYRSPDSAVVTGDPFRAYRITGQLAEEMESNCFRSKSNLCHYGNFTTGSYNFFDGLLKLTGDRELVCTTEGGGLNCDRCEFLKRVSNEVQGPRNFSPPKALDPFAQIPVGGSTDGIVGTYVGYVHHEYLNRYQPVRMHILGYQAAGDAGGPPTLRLSATATLYFGSMRSGESITYKFKERVFGLQSPQFTFSQLDLDVDAVVQISTIGKGEARGIWYSQLFGRVGTFYMSKSGAPKLPAGSEVIERVGGEYEGSEMDLHLQVANGSSNWNSENPFSPLVIRGWLLYRDITPRINIPGGTYDFYTGKFGFSQSDTIHHVGLRTSRKYLSLRRTSYTLGGEIRPFVPTAFRLVENGGVLP